MSTHNIYVFIENCRKLSLNYQTSTLSVSFLLLQQKKKKEEANNAIPFDTTKSWEDDFKVLIRCYRIQFTNK